MTYNELYHKGTAHLKEAGVPDPAFDARELLLSASGFSYQDYILKEREDAPADTEERYRNMIRQRAERIPLQHITGEQDFMGYPFEVNEDVLIPRQDTETLVLEAEKYLYSGMKLVDVCTGSGCIVLSLLKRNLPKYGSIHAEGIDISEKALAVARRNARHLDLESRVLFLEGDLLKGRTVKYDMIVSNPPYIPSGEIPGLMPEVSKHDPVLALDGGEDGLEVYRELIPEAYEALENRGMLLLEIGYDEADAVTELMQRAGFYEITTLKDLGGNDRVIRGRRIDR